LPSLSISRTIYNPYIEDFITSTLDPKVMPNIKEWIKRHNPVIYWYILRLDNPADTDISQWAVELYVHQALTITEAYIDGSDRRFELRKERHDLWMMMHQNCIRWWLEMNSSAYGMDVPGILKIE
jgi:hypothetical protein